MRHSLAALALALAALAPATPALAHAHLVSSTPAANAAISAPGQVSVTFNEKLVPAFSKLSVSMAMSGMTMNVPVKTVLSADGKTLTAKPQGALMKGAYVIDWAAASADGHKTKGSIPFKIK